MKKKILTLFLAAMMTFSLAACGNEDSKISSEGSGSQVEADAKGGDDSAQSDKKAEQKEEKKDEQPDVEPIEAALKNMNAASSMEAEMVMEMDMTMSANGQEQAVESVTTMDMVCFYDTLKMKIDVTVDLGAQGSQSMSIYTDTLEDGTLMMYMHDGTQWLSEEAGEVDLAEYDARSNMSDSIGDISGYKNEGLEDLDGIQAYKYSYTMTKEETKESLMSSGSLDSLTSLGLTEAQLDTLMDDVGALVTYVWVDAENLYPVRYEMDMTEIMDKLMAGTIAAMGDQAQGLSMSIPKCTMVMTCSNFDNATEFEVPAEAKAAN